MTIFLVKADGIEWTTIVALCSTKERAEKAQEEYRTHAEEWHETLLIQEWELDGPSCQNDEGFFI